MFVRYPEFTNFSEPLGGYESLLSSVKAKRLLGWQPTYRWREQLDK
ncbi:hypothetical protein [Paenibacillus sp. OV219]|nr:hypothetical protein [Paenibacillus sp. OV219]SEO04069.1 hypothetical protein SAMN05518847_105324 [Paenibacillus sp. OV219]